MPRKKQELGTLWGLIPQRVTLARVADVLRDFLAEGRESVRLVDVARAMGHKKDYAYYLNRLIYRTTGSIYAIHGSSVPNRMRNVVDARMLARAIERVSGQLCPCCKGYGTIAPLNDLQPIDFSRAREFLAFEEQEGGERDGLIGGQDSEDNSTRLRGGCSTGVREGGHCSPGSQEILGAFGGGAASLGSAAGLED